MEQTTTIVQPPSTTTATTTMTHPTAAQSQSNVIVPQSWAEVLPEDLKGYVQNKGFKDPASVVDSYRNLEKLIGVKEKLLQVPDDLGSADMEKVWARLGRPEKPDAYSFKSEDADFDAWAKETFHKSGLTSNQAQSVVDNWNSYIEKINADMIAKQEMENNQKIDQLKKDWGSAYEQNLKIARGAGKQFGLSDEMVDAMEKSIGFAQTMNLLHQIGSKMGEGEFINGGTTSGGVLTPAQAQSRINELKMDREWGRKYIAGDVQARKEMEALVKMATGTF